MEEEKIVLQLGLLEITSQGKYINIRRKTTERLDLRTNEVTYEYVYVGSIDKDNGSLELNNMHHEPEELIQIAELVIKYRQERV